MSKRTLSAAVAVLVAILAYVAVTLVGQEEAYVAPVQGKNNTALFVVLPHHGLSNVHLATAQALMERHPQIKMEFLSFPKIEGKVKRMSDLGLASNPKAQPIGFRKLHGRNYDDVLAEVVGTDGIEGVLTLPGLKGIDKFCRDLQMYVSPWPAEEHYEIFSEIAQVINETDPAVVVLDSIFAPAIDATRESKRLHSIISPNTIVDIFAAKQPWGGMFWKYPMMGAGFKFPLPWYNIPSNAYQVARLVARMLYTPDVTAKKKYLMEKGLKDPINFFKMHHEDAPWITQTMEGASVPVEVVPRNVSAVGPIVISVASAEEQDPKMHAWLAKAPTILVNLGSSVTYSQVRATAMVQGMKQVLDQTDVQILWKFRKAEEYSDDFLAPVKDYLASGRLRLEKWLTVDPTSILESGHVVAFVHHGGANCYHEGVYAGVPHIILPLWVDLYNFAALVESLEIGVWGCPKTSPYWSGECIGDAILKVVDGGEKSKAMRENARSLGEAAKKTPGRYGAAETIAQLAGSGY